KKNPTVEKTYFLMKGIPGIDLEQYIHLKRNKNMLFNLLILVNLFSTCQDLQAEGIYHGDISAGNVMINPASLEVTFVDWGYSKALDQEGRFKTAYKISGTPPYLPPEV